MRIAFATALKASCSVVNPDRSDTAHDVSVLGRNMYPILLPWPLVPFKSVILIWPGSDIVYFLHSPSEYSHALHDGSFKQIVLHPCDEPAPSFPLSTPPDIVPFVLDNVSIPFL